MNDETRRFSDREFALVLRKAAELQATNPLTPAADGVRLSELKQIAAEAGIDPSIVERAVRELDAVGDESPRGTDSVRFTHWVPGEISAEDLGRLRDVIESAAGGSTRGTVEQVLDSVEWRSGVTSGTGTHVTITPRDGQTRIDMMTALANARAGVYVLGMTPIWLAGLFGGIGLSAAGLIAAPIAAILGIGIAPAVGLLGGHMLWKRIFLKKRKELGATFDRIRRAAEQLARSPEEAATLTDGQAEAMTPGGSPDADPAVV